MVSTTQIYKAISGPLLVSPTRVTLSRASSSVTNVLGTPASSKSDRATNQITSKPISCQPARSQWTESKSKLYQKDQFEQQEEELEQQQRQHEQQQLQKHHHQQQQQHQQLQQQLQQQQGSFRWSNLEIIECPPSDLKPKPSVDSLLFGHQFTDHMFRVDWTREEGWSTPRISQIHNIELHPAAKVLHYAVEAFEGTKAYRGQDGKIRFFRLDQNLKRLRQSAKRLALPDFDVYELTACIHKLVRLDEAWIPAGKGSQLASLYIRPTILGTEPSLGVATSKRSSLYVLLSPVGPYFKTGFKPVSLYADPKHVRAWPGGAGNSKLGSNYAPTIMVQREAESLGLQQVLWLYGDDMKLTEVGTMNVFVTYRDEQTGKLHLVTPPLTDGLILPGITRASIIELARAWPDVVIEERYMTISDIADLIAKKSLVEMFGAGTACIVCPINLIQLKDGTRLHIPYSDIASPDTSPEFLSKRILKAITDIQYGRVEHPWAQVLNWL